MSRVAESVAWLRRTFTWSNSPAAWRDRFGWLLWLVVGYGYYRWCAAAGNLGPVHLIVGLGLVAGLLLIGLVTETGVGRLFGPVLFYDVLRNARRGRFILMRWLYAVGLLLLLLWVHTIWNLDRSYRGAGLSDYKALAKLAEEYFIAFSITQFGIVVLLTPAYVAGAIAEEKDRKTLEFLLATDLDNREIVLGKLVSRMGNLALFVLTGLPVLSLMQFFGGIDPGLLLASFAATGLTAASLSGLSILNSVMRKRVRDAIVLTYVTILGYMLVTGVTAFVLFMLTPPFGPLIWAGIDWTWVFDWFHAGNPIFGLVAIIRTIDMNGPLPVVIATELERYAVFHGIVAVVSIAWAVLRLRDIALGQTAVISPRLKGRAARIRARRAVGQKPMTWKELRVEGRLRLGLVGRIAVGLLIAAGFVPVIMIVYFAAIEPVSNRHYLGALQWFELVMERVFSNWTRIGEEMNVWLRALNVVISTLMLLGVGVRAAGSVGGERDRDTLNSLMTTSLSTHEIMVAKWLGAMGSIRGFLWWLAAVWLVAFSFGAVSPAAIFLHAAAWFAPAACFASIGLWYSTVCRTTLRAIAWTIGTGILIGGGHWLCMAMCCFAPMAYAGSNVGKFLQEIAAFELGLTPVFIFGWDAFREFDNLKFPTSEVGMPACAIIGMVVWSIAAGVIFAMAHERFMRMTNRLMIRKPVSTEPVDEANHEPEATLPSDNGEPPP